jgi:hypothetical protein
MSDTAFTTNYVKKPKVANPKGMVERGNINLDKRITKGGFRVEKDGFATLRSISVGTDRGTVLIPTVSPSGKQFSNEQAIDHFKATRKHLGIFKDEKSATSFAKQLSRSQGKRVMRAMKPKTIGQGGG